MDDEVTIARRFNGPPDSVNGGYACGVVAAAVPAPAARVSLRLPPPLEVPLRRLRDDHGRVTLMRDGAVVAEGAPAAAHIDAPHAPALADAERAMAGYIGWDHHVFPTCFVCGPERRDDGLGIFAGPVEGRELVASTWYPDEDLGAAGAVDPAIVWAALDCPTAFACTFGGPSVLAAMTAQLVGEVQAGRPHVVAAWPLGRNGRKHRAGSAVYSEDGTLLAVADALWVELKDPASFGAAR